MGGEPGNYSITAHQARALSLQGLQDCERTSYTGFWSSHAVAGLTFWTLPQEAVDLLWTAST